MLIEYTRRDCVGTFGIETGEFGWILKDNKGMLSIAELPSAKVTIGIGYSKRRCKKKDGAVAPPLFGAVKLLVNSWPAISERAETCPTRVQSQ